MSAKHKQVWKPDKIIVRFSKIPTRAKTRECLLSRGRVTPVQWALPEAPAAFRVRLHVFLACFSTIPEQKKGTARMRVVYFPASLLSFCSNVQKISTHGPRGVSFFFSNELVLRCRRRFPAQVPFEKKTKTSGPRGPYLETPDNSPGPKTIFCA